MTENEPQKRPAYSTRQAHVRKALGPADERTCVDCGVPAEVYTFDIEIRCPDAYDIEDARGVERQQCPHDEHFVALCRLCARDRAW